MTFLLDLSDFNNYELWKSYIHYTELAYQSESAGYPRDAYIFWQISDHVYAALCKAFPLTYRHIVKLAGVQYYNFFRPKNMDKMLG